MIIRRYTVSLERAQESGLGAVDMPRLGRFVALAGKNGAGKSRLLNLLESDINNRETEETAQRRLYRAEESIGKNYTGNVDRSYWVKEVADARRKLEIYKSIEAVNVDFKGLKFVPKELHLRDPRQSTNAMVNLHYQKAFKPSLSGFEDLALSYLQYKQNLLRECTHPDGNYPPETKAAETESFTTLDDLIFSFVGGRLGRTIGGEVTLFGKPIADAGLSDGQKIALQMAVAIHAQEAALDQTVFLLDELENHLHPSITIDLLERLTTVAPRSQIWIATHSVPLLAYIHGKEPGSLWYVEDGIVTHAGRRPEKVLRTLLGDEERLGQLHAFTGLPAALASTNFAAESLLPPATLTAERDDPQINQIGKILAERSQGRPLSLLDFGAGKGRLLDGLAALTKGDVAELVDYMAFDAFPGDEEVCRSVVAEHFGSGGGRYFGSEGAFFSCKDDGCVDVAVLCNVFHEIPPNQWLRLFAAGSLIRRALKDDGFLLLVEDQRIPVGEKAHEHGFLVLDTPQFRTLFAVGEADRHLFTAYDQRGDGRLKAHLIGKELMTRITSESRLRAVTDLRDAAERRIRELRSAGNSYANGQMHGFWTQQLANAYLYLSENS